MSADPSCTASANILPLLVPRSSPIGEFNGQGAEYPVGSLLQVDICIDNDSTGPEGGDIYAKLVAGARIEVFLACRESQCFDLLRNPVPLLEQGFQAGKKDTGESYDISWLGGTCNVNAPNDGYTGEFTRLIHQDDRDSCGSQDEDQSPDALPKGEGQGTYKKHLLKRYCKSKD